MTSFLLWTLACYLAGVCSHQSYVEWTTTRAMRRWRRLQAQQCERERKARQERRALWTVRAKEPGLAAWDALHVVASMPRGGLVP